MCWKGFYLLENGHVLVQRDIKQNLLHKLHLKLVETAHFGISPLNRFRLLLGVLTLLEKALEFDSTTTLRAFYTYFCVVHY